MVKRKLTLPLLCAAACAALVGCSAVRQVVVVHPEVLTLANGPLGPACSLADAGDSLMCVYSSPATTTLDAVQVPVGPRLPQEAPSAYVIDKIDSAPPLAPGFGQHVLTVQQGVAHVLYQDRRSESKTVLKIASRGPQETQWRLDVLEPAGDPVALLPGPRGAPVAFWSANALLARPLAASAEPQSLRSPFHLGSRPSVAGPTAFTAFDTDADELVAVTGAADGWSLSAVRGAGAVQASLVTPKGLLSVLSWDARTRRLLLHEQREATGDFVRTTVTLCNGTTSVALLPGPTPSTYLFVFDEVRAGSVGSASHQVSVIAPGPVLGALGARYRKAVLCAGDAPVQSLSAVVSGKALYVLVLQRDLKLLRVDLREQ